MLREVSPKKKLGRIQAVITDFTQVLRIDLKSVDAYFNKSFLNYRQGNHKLAIPSESFANADFNQALQINPNLADAYGNRGLAEYALGDRKSAITDLQQAASLFQGEGDTQRYQQTQALLQQIQQ